MCMTPVSIDIQAKTIQLHCQFKSHKAVKLTIQIGCQPVWSSVMNIHVAEQLDIIPFS